MMNPTCQALMLLISNVGGANLCISLKLTNQQTASLVDLRFVSIVPVFCDKLPVMSECQ